VFDRQTVAGGVPANIIPPFRIAREDIASDIDRFEKLGVEFRFKTEISTLVGREALYAEGFDSIVIAQGASRPRSLTLDGQGIPVIHALDFLRQCMEKGADSFEGARNVLVVGGGNTACDAVRMASRIPGVVQVLWSYRRSRLEMPADKEEIENAIGEASTFIVAPENRPSVLLELTLPEAIESGIVTLRRMKLGEKDASGRRRPVPTDETFALSCDLIISAVGELPDPTLFNDFGLDIEKSGLPVVDPTTLESSVPGIYVCGDARRGPSSIIASEADGRTAAFSILKKKGIPIASDDYRAPALDAAFRMRRGDIIEPLGFDDSEIEAR
jgi:putative selenate reductase